MPPSDAPLDDSPLEEVVPNPLVEVAPLEEEKPLDDVVPLEDEKPDEESPLLLVDEPELLSPLLDPFGWPDDDELTLSS